MYLDQTLERTIKRFEDEYPESKPKQFPATLSNESRTSSYIDQPSGQISRLTSLEDQPPTQPTTEESKLGRSASNTSLARALAQEEGRMHRFGQGMRREVLKPIGTDDALHGTSINDAPESPHLAALRQKLEHFSGEAIREEVEHKGINRVIKELGIDAQELATLERDDPEGFAKLKNAQITAERNTRMANRSITIVGGGGGGAGDGQGNNGQNIGYAM